MGCQLKLDPVIMEGIHPIKGFHTSAAVLLLGCGLTIPTEVPKQHFAFTKLFEVLFNYLECHVMQCQLLSRCQFMFNNCKHC